MDQSLITARVSQPTQQWQTPLFSCCEAGCGTCCYVFFCPSCAMADSRRALDQSNWCFNCLCLNPCTTNNIVREAYNIHGGCCEDFVLGWFCGLCSVSRIYFETQKRGRLGNQTYGQDGAENWVAGFCCAGGCSTGCYSVLCNPCATASARSGYDGSDWCFNLLCVPLAMKRNIIREGYNIQGGCCEDLLLSVCCATCVTCQMLTEVKTRGRVQNTAQVVVSSAPAAVIGTVVDAGGAHAAPVPEARPIVVAGQVCTVNSQPAKVETL